MCDYFMSGWLGTNKQPPSTNEGMESTGKGSHYDRYLQVLDIFILKSHFPKLILLFKKMNIQNVFVQAIFMCVCVSVLIQWK